MRPVSPVQYDFYSRRMPELIERFPHLFNKKFPEPLAIGTTKVLAELTDFTEFEIGQLLYVWCGRYEYLCMATSVGSRVAVDGSMKLMDPVQLRGFQKNVLRLNPNRLRQFARDFKIMYERNAFSSFTADENPLLTGLIKAPKQHHFDARLGRCFIQYNLDKSRAIAWGNIFDDKMTTGHHPFRDGTHIHTSSIKQIYCIAQVWFIETMNTTYRVIGEIEGLDFDHRKFVTPPPRGLQNVGNN
jgi:ProQ/FINO family.